MKLEGGERLVLKVLRDLQGDSTDYVDDAKLAAATSMFVEDVRDWLETLEGKGFIERTRLNDGFSAYVTAKGKQALRLTEPIAIPKSRTTVAGARNIAGPSSPDTSPPPNPVAIAPNTIGPIDREVGGSTSSNGVAEPLLLPDSPVLATDYAAAKATGPSVGNEPVQRLQGIAPPIRIYYSYSHKDEKLLDRLVLHLAPFKRDGLISDWYDRHIRPGSDWWSETDENLNSAHIILLLVSPSYMVSDFCFHVETKRALERHCMGEARVIPVILRPVNWFEAPFRYLQALPKDAKPVTTWTNRDKAFENVVAGILKVVEQLRKSSASE